eukprot:COSAG05_NODE_1180_length_5597_cov_2.237541_1_plen_238_part_00
MQALFRLLCAATTEYENLQAGFLRLGQTPESGVHRRQASVEQEIAAAHSRMDATDRVCRAIAAVAAMPLREALSFARHARKQAAAAQPTPEVAPPTATGTRATAVATTAVSMSQQAGSRQAATSDSKTGERWQDACFDWLHEAMRAHRQSTGSVLKHAHAHAVFASLDCELHRYADIAQFEGALQRLGVALTAAEVHAVFSALDSQQVGRVEYPLLPARATPESASLDFDTFDCHFP